MRKLPKLAFDHEEILKTATRRLRNKISYEPVGFELLDKKFLFSELHKLYETLKGEKIDRRNFKKKIMSLGVVEELDEQVVGGRGRPGSLFRFNKRKFDQLRKQGILFEV